MIKTEELSIFEKIQQVNPEAEIWWDSSPLLYMDWAKELVESTKDEQKKEKVTKTLDRFYNPDSPEQSFFRGVTTNPLLSLDVLNCHTQMWASFTKKMKRISPGKSPGWLFWQLYKEIVKRGAAFFLPVFENSDYKYGYISAQLDPRDRENFELMLEQAEELAALSPNVMIKVPGTKEGYEVIRALTARGIPTNNTLSFIIPQFIACANAVKEGYALAKKNGIDLTTWSSAITFMSSRFTSLGDLGKEAEQQGIELSEEDIRWAEIAIAKKAYRILHEGNYLSKMLICSMRISPTVNGEKRCWHLEKLAGASMIFTCPPKFIASFLVGGNNIEIYNQIDDPVPADILEKLAKIEYFARGYDEKGYTCEEFNLHPALLNTAREFSQATNQMIDFVKKSFPACS